ncbi:MAG: glycosyltransferase family 9 protein [Bdellovibrionales bacterium]|nr:glycosyltransferase family 9 protein [Bdellovibrionales bacterium]
MKPNPKKRALLVRMDRMGDLILTLPVDQNDILKDYDCTWFITQGLGFIADCSSPVRTYREWKREWSWSQFREFLKAIRESKPDVSVSFHVPWWVNLALFLARIPLRIGVLSQWHSYLFLSRGVRQKRSECLFHEMEYNNRLVYEGFGESQIHNISPLVLKNSAEPPVAIDSPFIIVHPGMGGSALNWPMEHYRDLISLVSSRFKVVVTGTKADRFIVDPLKKALSDNMNILWLSEKLSGRELITLASQARALVAPSTGVVHIAASLAVPTFGLYSSIKVESAQRWGPQGPFVQVFTLDLTSPQQVASALFQLPNSTH